MGRAVESSVDVWVPAANAYAQWSRFEEFPQFMRHVESVQVLGDGRLHWKAEVGGKLLEWDAQITEQIPEKRIAWKGISGARHAGVVTFHRLADDKCRVMLQLEYEPHGLIERVGDFFGVPQRDIEEDLQRFAKFVETVDAGIGATRRRRPRVVSERQPS